MEYLLFLNIFSSRVATVIDMREIRKNQWKKIDGKVREIHENSHLKVREMWNLYANDLLTSHVLYPCFVKG